MGKIRVRVVATADGKPAQYIIIGHSDGANCQNTDGKALLEKLSKQSVPGFGGETEIVDSWKTSEFYESGSSVPIDKVDASPNFEEEEATPEEQKRSLDLGYGT